MFWLECFFGLLVVAIVAMAIVLIVSAYDPKRIKECNLYKTEKSCSTGKVDPYADQKVNVGVTPTVHSFSEVHIPLVDLAQYQPQNNRLYEPQPLPNPNTQTQLRKEIGIEISDLSSSIADDTSLLHSIQNEQETITYHKSNRRFPIEDDDDDDVDEKRSVASQFDSNGANDFEMQAGDSEKEIELGQEQKTDHGQKKASGSHVESECMDVYLSAMTSASPNLSPNLTPIPNNLNSISNSSISDVPMRTKDEEKQRESNKHELPVADFATNVDNTTLPSNPTTPKETNSSTSLSKSILLRCANEKQMEIIEETILGQSHKILWTIQDYMDIVIEGDEAVVIEGDEVENKLQDPKEQKKREERDFYGIQVTNLLTEAFSFPILIARFKSACVGLMIQNPPQNLPIFAFGVEQYEDQMIDACQPQHEKVIEVVDVVAEDEKANLKSIPNTHTHKSISWALNRIGMMTEQQASFQNQHLDKLDRYQVVHFDTDVEAEFMHQQLQYQPLICQPLIGQQPLLDQPKANQKEIGACLSIHRLGILGALETKNRGIMSLCPKLKQTLFPIFTQVNHEIENVNNEIENTIMKTKTKTTLFSLLHAFERSINEHRLCPDKHTLIHIAHPLIMHQSPAKKIIDSVYERCVQEFKIPIVCPFENDIPSIPPFTVVVAGYNSQNHILGPINPLFSDQIHVLAPGDSIITTHLNNSYAKVTSHSMASIMTVGALIWIWIQEESKRKSNVPYEDVLRILLQRSRSTSITKSPSIHLNQRGSHCDRSIFVDFE